MRVRRLIIKKSRLSSRFADQLVLLSLGKNRKKKNMRW